MPQLSVNNPVLDFETRPSYTLQVQVEDDDLAKVFAYVTVNVINANDPPVFGSVSEYTTPELTVGSCTPTACMAAAVDPEGGSLTYTISRQDQPQAWDITSGGELVVSKAKVLNFEVKTRCVLQGGAAGGRVDVSPRAPARRSHQLLTEDQGHRR